MTSTLLNLLAATVVLPLLVLLIPHRIVSTQPRLIGRLTTILVGLAFLASLASAVRVAVTGPIDATFVTWTWPVPVSLGVYVDSISVTMTLLISFIGLIIARYSLNYLHSDVGQGRFFRWMAFTIGATLLMVVARNLVMFTAAWMMTSYGLHQLLTYYANRTWAIWAARKKFLISRLGDLMLITALILTYRSFGTFEYTELFAATDAIRAGSMVGNTNVTWIGLFLVLGAMTKSAQFPFHSWLPDTLESPTPVSALMQAGVINAGGFLMIRLSPLVTLSPVALDLLTLIGLITALMGSVIMLTQASIKRSLAYSTIAQMGFMMLQCGLGAWSAALLHIVAHSAYKAHTYLSCGSTLDAVSRANAPAMQSPSIHRNVIALIGAVCLSTGIVFGILQTNLVTTSTDLARCLVLMLALLQMIWQGLTSVQSGLPLRSLGLSIIVAFAYVVSYHIFASIVVRSMPDSVASASSLNGYVLALVVIGFLGIFSLQLVVRQVPHGKWIRPLYVHAMNGFYIDIPARRLTALIYRQVAPVQ